jgi:hypothetical protein
MCGAAGVIYLLWGRPWWFVVACLALAALDLFAVIGHTLDREPRLLLMPCKGFAIASATLWGWGTGWILAIAAYLAVRRAFLFLLDGLTISAAEALQGDRDRRTAALFERLKNDNAPKHPRERIILYLRPFTVTGQIKLDEGEFLNAVDGTAIRDEHNLETKQWARTTLPLLGFHIGVQESVSLFEQNSEIETHLEQALRGAGHFIALGRPGEALGAGRLSTAETEWKDSATLLINAATLCIIIPSAHPGTQWEIRHIVQSGHLEKSCILMPPAVGQNSYAREWNAARAALADILPLPEYQANGAIFRCSANTDGTSSQPPAMPPTPSSFPQLFAIMIQALFPELPRWKVEADHSWIQFGVRGGVSYYVEDSGAGATKHR